NYSEAIRLNTKDARSYYGRAYAYGLKHDFEKVIEDCTKVLALEPKTIQAYSFRADAYWKQGNFTKALNDLDAAIRINPDSRQAYETRGEMFERRGEFAKAAKDFREVVRIQPSNADSQRSYAWALVCWGDKSKPNGLEAMQAAKMACELRDWTNAVDIEVL